MTRAIYMPGVCRECGCTEKSACVVSDGCELDDGEAQPTCYWVEPDLCSECAEDVELEDVEVIAAACGR